MPVLSLSALARAVCVRVRAGQLSAVVLLQRWPSGWQKLHHWRSPHAAARAPGGGWGLAVCAA